MDLDTRRNRWKDKRVGIRILMEKLGKREKEREFLPLAGAAVYVVIVAG